MPRPLPLHFLRPLPHLPHLHLVRPPHLLRPPAPASLFGPGARFTGPGLRLIIGLLAGLCGAPALQAQAQAETQIQAPLEEAAPRGRLSPRVRSESLPGPAREVLPAALIAPFLRGLQVMEPQALAQAARIVASHSERALNSRGDIAFVRGMPGQPVDRSRLTPGDELWVLRPGQPLRDPASGAILGYETRQVARARLLQEEDRAAAIPRPAVIELISASEEVRTGDLLLAQTPVNTFSFEPHAPQVPVQARVLAVDSQGAMMAGPREGLIINRGRLDGLEPGHLLSLRRTGQRTTDRLTADPLQLPDESLGVVMVVRVQERLSQALILRTRDGVRPGDELVGGP